LGITIEQITRNGRPIWVHVSTRGTTHIARTFPGTITFEPAEASIRLSRRQVRRLTDGLLPPITNPAQWQQIFRRLSQLEPSDFAQVTAIAPVIPRTKMRKLFEECGQSTSLGAQLCWAKTLNPKALAKAFVTSIEQFTPYRREEPFHPARTPLPASNTITSIRSSRDLASLLGPQQMAEVINGPHLNFQYVDYELVPARTTGGTTYDDGKRATTWVRLDQLLAGDRPIIAEVKIRKDKNPFYALIQALTAAVELLTPAQHDRLRKYYPKSFPNNNDQTVDIYLILYQWSRNRQAWQDLLTYTQETCHALSRIAKVQKYVTTFAILELLEPRNRTVSFKRLFTT
jgi:hypothetical protein